MRLTPRTVSVRQLYVLTTVFAVAGAIWMFTIGGGRPALAFFLGACASLGNLWLFHKLARGIEPGAATRKPWQAGAFATRYLIFLAVGYVIVNALGVSPLPVALGLFASTAAVLSSSLLELVSTAFGTRRT